MSFRQELEDAAVFQVVGEDLINLIGNCLGRRRINGELREGKADRRHTVLDEHLEFLLGREERGRDQE